MGIIFGIEAGVLGLNWEHGGDIWGMIKNLALVIHFKNCLPQFSTFPVNCVYF